MWASEQEEGCLNIHFDKGAIMPLVKRRFRVKCVDEPCEKLAERISDGISIAGEYSVTIQDGFVTVEFYGYESEIKKAWNKIKSMLAGSPKVEKGVFVYDVNAVFKDIGSTFPPRVLVEVLRRQGFTAVLSGEGDKIRTNASRQTVYSISSRIAEVARSIPGEIRGLSTKYYLLTISVLTSLPVEEVIGRGIEAAHLKRDENGFITLNIEWLQGVDDFLKRVKYSSG